MPATAPLAGLSGLYRLFGPIAAIAAVGIGQIVQRMPLEATMPFLRVAPVATTVPCAPEPHRNITSMSSSPQLGYGWRGRCSLGLAWCLVSVLTVGCNRGNLSVAGSAPAEPAQQEARRAPLRQVVSPGGRGPRLVELVAGTEPSLQRLPSTQAPLTRLPAADTAPPGVRSDWRPAAPAPHLVTTATPIPEPAGPQLENYESEKSLSMAAAMEDRLRKLPTTSRGEPTDAKVPESVQRQAELLLAEAIELADRGALYAARVEFLRVLRLVTQSLDASLGRPVHAPALLIGLRALEEADDFAMADPHLESDVALEGILATHHTPVLKQCDTSQLTPLLAIQKYYEFACEHLALAGNRQPVASEALFSLGRIQSLLTQTQGESSSKTPRSIAYFTAALTVNPRNSRAANELGVLLARRGRLEEARDVLSYCARTAPSAVALRNLSQVEERLGYRDRAHEALQMASRLTPADPAEVTPPGMPWGTVRWVDATTFTRLSATPGGLDPQLAEFGGSTPSVAPGPGTGVPGAQPTDVAPRMATEPARATWFLR